MPTGLLWYDEKQPLETQLPQAIRRYHERQLDGEPNICYVSPQALLDGETTVCGVLLRADPGIAPHYFWLVHEVKQQPAGQLELKLE